jgi:hypothetical protein
MKDFFLNFTRIIEANPKIYWSIIVGIVLCLGLFVIEAIHIQQLVTALKTQDQALLKQAIEPLAQRYTWSRVVVLIATVFVANYEYSKTKKRLGLVSSK